MAGDWIKVETTTPDKPEIFQLAEILDIDPDAVTGKLLRVWIWADLQTIDGNAKGVTKMLLDRIAGVTGFANSMLQVGWLVEKDGALSFTNFGKHNGNGAKKRAETNKRVASHRKNVKQKCNAKSVTKSVTREEKRREDIKGIFRTWQAVMSSPTSKLTTDKQTKINARLDEGYSVEDLEKAIRGCAASSFHMGENNDKKKYNSIDLIFRNGGKVEEFMGGGSSEKPFGSDAT